MAVEGIKVHNGGIMCTKEKLEISRPF
jgi:hypothetical protein